jgi:hypothetical protein
MKLARPSCILMNRCSWGHTRKNSSPQKLAREHDWNLRLYSGLIHPLSRMRIAPTHLTLCRPPGARSRTQNRPAMAGRFCVSDAHLNQLGADQNTAVYRIETGVTTKPLQNFTTEVWRLVLSATEGTRRFYRFNLCALCVSVVSSYNRSLSSTSVRTRDNAKFRGMTSFAAGYVTRETARRAHHAPQEIPKSL